MTHFTSLQRFGRRSASAAVKYLLLLLGFAFINIAPALRTGLAGRKPGPSATECASLCRYQDTSGNFGINATQRTSWENCYKVRAGARPCAELELPAT